jgi:hypothetical protein
MDIKIASSEISEILKSCVLCFIGYLWICIVHEVQLKVDLVGLLNVRSLWYAVVMNVNFEYFSESVETMSLSIST